MSGISTKNLPLSQNVAEVIGNDSQDNTVRITRQVLQRLISHGIAEDITAAGGMGVFATASAGLNATEDGDYFAVAGTGDDYLILYRNDDGEAEEIGRSPSLEALDNEIAARIAGDENETAARIAGDDAVEEQVTRLASSEEMQAINAQVEAPEWAVAWADPEGNVAGGFDEQGRFIARIGQDVEQYEAKNAGRYSVAFVNPGGDVALGLNRHTGGTDVSGLSLPGYDIIVAPNPGIAIAFADAQGRASRIIYDDGSEVPSGGGAPPLPEPHEVLWSFAEPVDDPSKELFLTWLSTSPDGKTLEYQPRGAGSWASVRSFRSRPYPVLDGLWLHTVWLKDLSPDTIYDFRIPQTFYSDAVKTCPADNSIRLAFASDWQASNYTAQSTLRILGDVATDQSPDLMIWGGDFHGGRGEYTEYIATGYYNIFSVLHEHWRGPEGVQVPWVITLGNHEGGYGIPGVVKDICSWTLVPEHQSAFGPSAATVRIANLLALVSVEPGYYNSMQEQLPWFESQLSAHLPNVEHSLIVSHIPPFNTLTGPLQYFEPKARMFRNHYWTAAQDYSGTSGSLRAWLSGHVHHMCVTAKLKMAYDPQASDEVNDANFYRDPEGFVNLGFGPVGRTSDRGVWDDGIYGLQSNIDGTVFWDAVIAEDPNAAGTPKTGGAVTNVQWPISNIWVIELEAGQWSATCFNVDGDPFYQHQEVIGAET